MKQLDFKFQNEENMIKFKENVMEIINSASSNYVIFFIKEFRVSN